MTNRTDATAEKSFVSALLPWIVAGAAAVIYLLTLNHWLSFKNLQSVARATGQTWTPQIYLPCFTLVTSPFHWLPATWVPVALNLFSVVCAFFVLVLLARSVALLPHDRTQKQRERQHGNFALLSSPLAWVPIVLAVLACGLQLTFWENATTLSSGMFDLVLFAYSVRCLLEYRVSKRESWILRASVVYAAGATDSWVLIALFPGFLAAVIWMRGLSFFNLQFLSRLFLCLIAGLLLYLYLPVIHWKHDGFFWIPLRENVSAQFTQVYYIIRYTQHHVQFLLTLTSLLPILIIGIRWKSSFGDTSEIGVTLATWFFHLSHAVLLALCIFGMFDTGFGLRDAAGRFPMLTNNRDNLLPLYFLSALSIGYFAGYFLLVFGPVTRRGGRRPSSGGQKLLNKVSIAAVCLLLVLTSVGLLYKNIPEIKLTNGPTLQNYASLIAEDLPPQAVLLSDTPAPLLITQAWLARNGKDTNFVFLETHSLRSPTYYRFQTRHVPDLLPKPYAQVTNDVLLNDFDTMNLVIAMSEKRPVYYLHPSFGFFYEAFHPIPHGLTYEMQLYPPTHVLEAPPLPDAVIAENESFWKQHDSQLHALASAITPPVSEMDSRQRLLQKLNIPLEKNGGAVQLGYIYSRALNTWGVDAQRAGRLDAATGHFARALDLAPDNLVARANMDFNKKLRAGEHVTVENPVAFEQRFGKFGDWQEVLNFYGRFDEPTGCLAEGIVFARGRLNREAVQCFERTLALAPESVLARLWMARVYLVLREPENAFPLISELKSRSEQFVDAAITSSDILQLELAANYATTNRTRVDHLLENLLSQQPPEPASLDTAVQVTVFNRDYTNALRIVDRQLQLAPNDLAKLVNKGFIQVQLSDFDGAIPPLSKAISIQSTNATALLCRAAAYLQLNKLDEAKRDYETLQKMNPDAFPAYHGLGEIAWRKKDTNSAIQYYEKDLKTVPPTSPEAKFAGERLKSLKPGSP
jgi:tetratricopeptide (TPR) repeat protein